EESVGLQEASAPPRTIPPVRWGWVLALTLVGNALGTAQTTIKARPLLDDEAMGYRTAFVLDIERRGSNTHGELIVSSASDVVQVFPLDLAANARKRVYVAVPLFRSGQQVGRRTRFITPYAEWRGADGERVRLNLPLSLQAHLPIVVVGDMIGGLERLNGLEVPFNSALSVQHRSSSPPCKVYYLRPAALPDDWEPLLEFPMIALVDGAETLSESQWRALMEWLTAGGSLIVSVGSLGPSLKVLPIAPLLPPTQLAADGATPARITGELGDWRPIAVEDSREFNLYGRRVGLGTLYLFMGRLEQPEWRAWKGLPAMFSNIARSSAFPSERMGVLFDLEWNETLREDRYRRTEVGVIALGAYVALVWGLTAWLRRRRRLGGVAAPLAALTALASGAVLLFPPRFVTREPVVLARLHPGAGERAVEVAYAHAVLEAGRHTLTLPEGGVMLGFVAKPNATVQTHWVGASPTLTIHCHARVRIGVFFARPVENHPRLEVRWQADALRLRNLSGQTLNAVQLVARPNPTVLPETLWQRAELGVGQEVVVAIRRVSAPDNLWVQAFYQRRGAPLATLNGAPLQEVNTLCVFAP
ncbi:MAG: hypothetical protein N2554_08400, partial [Fimbriimonadales bacterium]|nr:hypothetical protein [Fimbriimonadales bacterium]